MSGGILKHAYDQGDRVGDYVCHLDGWTTDPPTEEGLYFLKLIDPKREEWAGMVQCVFVYLNDGKPYHSLQNGFSVTHWLGPLPIPEPPK
jgi:hypothetical protein